MRQITMAVLCQLKTGKMEFRPFTTRGTEDQIMAGSHLLYAGAEVEEEEDVQCVLAVLDEEDPGYEQLKSGMELDSGGE